ncbi:predicted protein [Bacteroides sp. CAG:530]|nr:predicted protein [Bacteroides sp. CAG:530]
MKIAFTKNIWSIVCLACFVLVGTSCNKNIGVEAVYITAAEKSSVTTFSATNENDEFGITISSSLIANSDIEGELTIDNSLVEQYNRNHGESYKALPEGACVLSNNLVMVESGKYRSEVAKLVVKDIDAIKKGVNFLLPVKLISKNKDYPSLPGSDVLYIIVNRKLLVDVPKLNGQNYFKINFKDNDVSRFQNMSAFTIEARVSMWEFPKYYGGNLMGVIGFPVGENAEKGTWIFVDGTPDRVGGEGNVPVFMFATKGWSVYAGKLGYTLDKNAWYHVAGVFENNTLSLYIDGILFVQAEYAKPISLSDEFYIGAAPGVQNGFHLKGAVSEARFWTRALTASELKNPLHRCFVEVDSDGLEGYWKLDDKSNECKDYTGHGHTAVKQGSGELEWLQEVPCP